MYRRRRDRTRTQVRQKRVFRRLTNERRNGRTLEEKQRPTCGGTRTPRSHTQAGTSFPLGTLGTCPGPRDRWGPLSPARSPTDNRYIII